jgi:hypothetical protein
MGMGMGKDMGMSDDQIKGRAEHIGDYLAKNVDPENPEQRILKELWESSSEGEQETIAGAIIKMVTKNR